MLNIWNFRVNCLISFSAYRGGGGGGGGGDGGGYGGSMSSLFETCPYHWFVVSLFLCSFILSMLSTNEISRVHKKKNWERTSTMGRVGRLNISPESFF